MEGWQPVKRPTITREKPDRGSWWIRPDVQADRAMFTAKASEEAGRMIGHPTFGGRKSTHDKGISR